MENLLLNAMISYYIRNYLTLKTGVILGEDSVYHNIDVQIVLKTLDIILSYVMRRLLCEMPKNA